MRIRYTKNTQCCASSKTRPVWFPGNEPPVHLDGSMAGDFGFDPLRLGTDKKYLTWFREAELQHCRWAMLGVTGVLVGELVRPDIDFYKAPQQLDGTFPFPIPILIATQFILFHYVELRRWQDFRCPGCVNRDPIFGENSYMITRSVTRVVYLIR